MLSRNLILLPLIAAFLSTCGTALGDEISVEGSPADSGFSVGSVATIRATVKGITGDARRYAVFAEIQYAGTTSVTSVQMDRVAEPQKGEAQYEIGWPIPDEAPTGLYTVAVRVEDRTVHRTVALENLRGFAAYKKPVQISQLTLDKTFYNLGDPLQCQLTLENLTDAPLENLRVEFSNANYPWISLYAREGGENPDLGLKVLRDHLTLAARGTATIPMTNAGIVSLLQGKQKGVMGVGAPARHEKAPPPEVDTYTVSVWNADRTILYDMRFTPPAIVRPSGSDLPTPYGRNYTHPYNSDIDFVKYRNFYEPGQVSPVITVDHSRTLYRPGDQLRIEGRLKNSGAEAWSGAELRATILDPAGKIVRRVPLVYGINLGSGQTRAVAADAWAIPSSQLPGTYQVKLELIAAEGRLLAEAGAEIALNMLPASVLVVCPHEDDELAYAGLIRAAVEAGIPVRVLILTDGDVGECERYYDKACGPNEAREFGMVRMQESREALEHLGLTRDKVDFLGLPDGGLGAIWSRHIKASNAFLSVYLACDHAPYEQVFKPNLPYARDSVMDALEQTIAGFHPALIALPHPDERHVDHRATNWLAIKACQELLRQQGIDPQTVVWGDRAYGAGGFKPAPYQYEKSVVYLSGEAAALKQQMSWIYQSQDGNLDEGMKKTFSELPRQEEHVRILDWQEHEGWNEF
jgi:LmbE family N-acetylglucosaminyl deacetylase